MPQFYLYGCDHCPKDIQITEKHAGMTQVCPFCDHSNTYPGLRQIRQLPIQDETADVQKATSKNSKGFSETGSWLFSGGLLVAVVSGLLGLALLNYANSIATESTVNERIEFGNSQIRQLPSGLLWDAWDQMTKNGMPDWSETQENRYNKQSGYLSYIAYGLFGISFLGVLALAVPLISRR